MSNWLQDIGRFIRGETGYDDRAMPHQLDIREAAGDQIIKWNTGRPQWLEKNVHHLDKHAYRRVSLIFACIQYLSNSSAVAPLKLMRTLSNDQEEEAPDHDLTRLLQRPNEGQGGGRFISFWTLMAVLTGFGIVEKERDQYGRVIGLWVLRSDWLRPIPRSAGITDWEYAVPGHDRPFIIEAEDTIPLSYADVMTGDPTGIGPVEVIFQEAQILNELDDYIKEFLDNKAMPQYFAIPDTDGPLAAQWGDPDTVDAFREKFNQTYGGLRRTSSVMVSPAIKDLKQMGFNMNELAYRDLRAVNEASITTAFGIPPILLNTLSGLEHATYSNYGQARRAFYEDKMVPWWSRIDDALTRHLLPEFETDSAYNLVFDLSEVPALRDDESATHDRAVSAFTSALVSRHAAQRMAGIKPHGPDVFMVPFSSIQQPVNSLPKASATISQLDDDARALPAPRFIRRDGRLYINEATETPQERASAQQFIQHQRELMGRLGGLLEPRAEAFLRAQGARMIEEATNERSAETFEVRAIDQYDWFADDDELMSIMRQWWAQVTESAFGSVSQSLGVDFAFGGSNPFLGEIEGMLGHRIRGINETTRDMVETIVREQLQQGTSIPDLKEALEEWIEPTYKNRAQAIARTESQVALNTATEKAYAATGQVSHVRMFDNPLCDGKAGSDGLTCPQRNGLVVPLAQIQEHINGEHPNGTLAYAAVLDPIEGVDW